MDLNASIDSRLLDGPPTGLAESKIHEIFGLTEILGYDVSGTLFRASKTINGKPIAVALLSPGFSMHNEQLLTVEHPNICKIHQIINRVDGTEAMVMDLPNGLPMGHLLDNGTFFSINQVISVLLQLLSAMHAIHKKEETLFSLTPNNIFIAEDDKGSLHLKLVGFGVTSQETDFLSPDYLSPELIVDSNMRGVTSDIWTVGAVFYHLLFGHVPFEGEHAYDAAQKIMLEEPPYEDEIRQIPGQVLEILKTFLNKDTSVRYQTVNDAVAILLPLKARFSDTIQPPQIPDLAFAATDPPESPFSTDSEEFKSAPPPLLSHRLPEEEDPTQNISVESTKKPSPELDQTVYSVEKDDVLSLQAAEDLIEFERQENDPIAEDMTQDTQITTPPPHASESKAASAPISTESIDSDTLLNKESASDSMAGTKIDDLARAAQSEPLSIDAISEKLKKTTYPKSDPKKIDSAPKKETPKPAIQLSEQSKLIGILLIFTIVSISFTILLVFLLRGQPQYSKPAMQAAPIEPAAQTQTTQPKTKAPPPPVAIDLLRLPTGAKVMLNDAPADIPIRLPRSKVAVKLTVQAAGFKSFERLIVPDRDRKILVEMARKPRKTR